jgi:hypothetical protein
MRSQGRESGLTGPNPAGLGGTSFGLLSGRTGALVR